MTDLRNISLLAAGTALALFLVFTLARETVAQAPPQPRTDPTVTPPSEDSGITGEACHTEAGMFTCDDSMTTPRRPPRLRR